MLEGIRRYQIVRRANRFSVMVSDGSATHMAHLTNSGRLLDLIYPGNTCLCVPKTPSKTTLRLVGVPVSERWAVLVDPGEQSRSFVSAVRANLIPWLAGWEITRSEVRCGESRIDLEIGSGGRTGYIEIKSAAMLIRNNTGSFPDCPTARGRKHVGTMRRLAGRHRSIIVFLVQHPDAMSFSPNVEGDARFAADLGEAVRNGVEVRAVKTCLGMNGEVAMIDSDLYCYT